MASGGGGGGGGGVQRTILDKPLVLRPRGEVSLSAFAFLFSEMVQYSQERSQSVDEMQKRLEAQGHRVGHKVYELQCWREKQGKGDGKRYNRLIELLTFISSTVWKSLFGKAADSLERSTEAEDEYMIMEAEPVTNTFVSVQTLSIRQRMSCMFFFAVCVCLFLIQN